MSLAKVETVRNGIATWNRGDADLWLTYGAPEIEWVPAGPAAVESTAYNGYDEVSRGLAAVWDTCEVFEFGESEVRDLGDSVLWLGHVKMRGGTSHVELNHQFALHNLLSRTLYTDIDEARAAAERLGEERA